MREVHVPHSTSSTMDAFYQLNMAHVVGTCAVLRYCKMMGDIVLLPREILCAIDVKVKVMGKELLV